MDVDADLDPEDLPILGEPLPLELANTLYRADGGVTDFLATPAAAQLWLRHALGAVEVEIPPVVSADEAAVLRRLRDAVFDVVSAMHRRQAPKPASVRELNRHAASASAHAELTWSTSERPSARVRFRGPRFAQLCAKLATACIELCTDEGAGEVRVCEGPGCTLMFLQHHGRRRFCHDGCSHRARQRRYARSLEKSS